jgi:Ca2+-binding RTX toxin-like protein
MGGLGDDTITGSYADDDLEGGPGDDKIAGSAGDDTVRGGAGDDVLAGDDFTGIRAFGVFPDPDEPPTGRFTPHVDLNTWLWERFLRIVNEERLSRMFQPVPIPGQAIDGGSGRDQAPIFDASNERLWNIESYPGQKVQLVGVLRPGNPGSDPGAGDTQIVGNHFVLPADSSKVSDQASRLMNRKVFGAGTLGYQSVYTAWLHTIIHIEKIQAA